jgi:hypothetical protein
VANGPASPRAVEFEYSLRSFFAHGHDPQQVALVICYTLDGMEFPFDYFGMTLFLGARKRHSSDSLLRRREFRGLLDTRGMGAGCMKNQIKIGEPRRLLLFLSEPYVIYTRMGYQPAIDVQDVQSGESGYLVISAVSLGEPLHEISIGNQGILLGKTVSLRKESADRMSKYIVIDPSGSEE